MLILILLAIIDGMVVSVGSEKYVIPTLSIVKTMRPEPKNQFKVLDKGEMLKIQGNLIPLFRLGKLFKIGDAETDATKALVAIVEEEGRKAGLLVDRLLGQQQIVIKNLGGYLSKTEVVAGGAIMPDGRVGLILDVGGGLSNWQTKDATQPTKSQNNPRVGSKAPHCPYRLSI